MMTDVQALILVMEAVGMKLVEKKLVYFYYLLVMVTIFLFIYN